MKLKDILLESPTDVVARFYKEASNEYDRFYNPEDAKYKDKNREYYKKYFTEWFKNEEVPVFTKPVTAAQSPFTTKPKSGKIQSPGYRGREYAKAAAGIPYDRNVQAYKPDPSKIVAQQTMDGARNSNGQ